MTEEKVIQKLLTIDSHSKKAKDYIGLVADDINSYVGKPSFYELPDKILVKIFKKCEEIECKTIKKILANTKGKQYMFLPYLKPTTSDYDEMASVVEEIKDFPFIEVFYEKLADEERCAERDWKYEYEQKEKELRDLRKDHDELEKQNKAKNECLNYVCIIDSAIKEGKYASYQIDSINELKLKMLSCIKEDDVTSDEINSALKAARKTHKDITGKEEPQSSDARVEELKKIDIKKLTFDEAMSTLEEAIAFLEQWKYADDQELYEFAQRLKAYCSQLLKSERSEIVRIANANNIPLSEIGLSDY